MRASLGCLLAAVLLAVSPAMAGCGGGDDAASTAGIAKAAFLKRADAICAGNYESNREGFESFTGKAKREPFSTEREIRAFADTVLIPNKRREVRELRALRAPSGDEDEVEAILRAYEKGIATAREDARAAVTSASGVFVEATELAERYGLDECRY